MIFCKINSDNFNLLTVSVSFLHARLRTCTLHHDEEGQAMLINLLLRNYLHYNLYDQVRITMAHTHTHTHLRLNF